MILVLNLAAGMAAAAGPWQQLPPLPEPNGGSMAGVIDGKIIVAGGTNWRDGRKLWLAAVHSFDPVTLAWSTRDPLPQPLAYSLAGIRGGALVIAGGTTGVAPYQGLAKIEANRTSCRAGGGIKAPCVLSAGGLIGDEFIFTGGSDDAAKVSAFSRDTFAVHLETGEQRALPPFPGTAFGIAATAVAAGELLVFGGGAWDPASQSVVNLAEAHAFSPRGAAWRRLRSLPYAVRGLAAVALGDQRIYLAGGYTNEPDGFTNRAWIYDVVRDTYTPSVPLPYRSLVSLVVNDGYLYCLGGEDWPKRRTDVAYRISVSALAP